MDINGWQHSPSIEYEDRLRRYARSKPAYPTPVFEFKLAAFVRRALGRLALWRRWDGQKSSAQSQRELSAQPEA